MSTTLRIEEGAPAVWPAAPAGLSARAAALAPGVVWSRLEAWTGFRWAARPATFTAEGPGEWLPPLRPFTVATVERWTGSAWEASPLTVGPLGGVQLDGAGPYRIAGDLGGEAPAPAVLEAFRRLAEFSAAPADRAPGSSRETVSIGELSTQVERSPAWLAKAIINSGAADLLRPWRRAG